MAWLKCGLIRKDEFEKDSIVSRLDRFRNSKFSNFINMAKYKQEIVTYFGRCRCCLSYGYLKNMWKEYYSINGNIEVYANMLEQCYGLAFEHSETSDHDQICSLCVKKLKDALEFKTLILESNSGMTEDIEDIGPKVKNEIDDIDENREDDEDMVEYEITTVNDSETLEFKEELFKVEMNESCDDSQNGDYDNVEFADSEINNDDDFECEMYGEIEYLEDDIESKQIISTYANDEKLQQNKSSNKAKEGVGPRKRYTEEDIRNCLEAIRNKSIAPSLASVIYHVPMKIINKMLETNDLPKRQWPKKLPKTERNRRNKQYTEDDFRTCLEAVRNGTMSPASASVYYNVPKKTIINKMNSDDVIDEKKELIYQFHKEIKSILSFTNGTPFRSNVAKFSCIYCLEAVFTDPEELRNHTRTAHIDERTKKVDIFMRPHYENEILKLDIHNLFCVVCSTMVPEWNDMLRHLEESHKLSLGQVYSKVVPYILESELNCALCKAPFSSFITLDGHMNYHYDNYICSDCGDTFLTQARLKAHQKTHEAGRHPCEVCGKVFQLERNKRKHIRMVHLQDLKFKCAFCDDVFTSEVGRQKHLEKEHADKMKSYHCDECDKVFHWRQYYVSHKKKAHGEKIYVCVLCGKSYSRNYQLQEHMASHSKEKTVECPVCHKMYTTKTSMRMHLSNQHRKKGNAGSS